MGGSSTTIRSQFIDEIGPDGSAIRRKVSSNLSMYVRNQKWTEQKNERLKREKSIKKEKAKAELTFKPSIKEMIRE